MINSLSPFLLNKYNFEINTSFGFYEDKKKIAIIDYSYTLIFNTDFFNKNILNKVINNIKNKIPKFPINLFGHEE